MSSGKRPYCRTPEESFAVRIVKQEDGCWVWTGAKNDQMYGQIKANGRVVYAHRWAYERFVGPIPPGLVIDHLCENTLCANPDHLQPLTNRENIVRSTSIRCRNGHLRTTENTRRRKDGRVQDCLDCRRERGK